MKKHLQNLRNEQGLTLVELLAVVVIIAIIAVIAFVMIGKVIDNSKKDAHLAHAIQMIEAAKLHSLSTDKKGDAETFLIKDLLDGEVLRDAWTKEELTVGEEAKVEKSADGEYSVVKFPAEDGSNCTVDGATEEDLLTKDSDTRDSLCNIGPTPTP